LFLFRTILDPEPAHSIKGGEMILKFRKLQSFIGMAYVTAFWLCTSGAAWPQSAAPSGSPTQPQTTAREKTMNFHKITPNLIVADMEKSLKFYRDVLGFTVSKTVPDKAPFYFAWLKRGEADIFLNQQAPPQPGQPDVLAGRQIGGTLSMYIAMERIEDLLKTVESQGVKIAIPLHKEFYGMKEFAVFDADGYLIIFAEPAQ
jgi:catechol 2,3-dioxygenase-like lactoylglutathione lyase family enzyme